MYGSDKGLLRSRGRRDSMSVGPDRSGPTYLRRRGRGVRGGVGTVEGEGAVGKRG